MAVNEKALGTANQGLKENCLEHDYPIEKPGDSQEFKNLIVLNGKEPIETAWQRWCVEVQPAKPKKTSKQNYGIPTGPANGIIVLDIDDKEKFRAYCENNEITMTETFTVKTGKGHHFYFQYPKDGHDFGSKNQNKPYGFDIRGIGGQVVAPGSVHPDTGKIYQVVKNLPFAPMPDWMKALYKEPEKPKQKNTACGSFTGNIETLHVKQSTKGLIKTGLPVGQRSEAIMTVLNALVYASLSDAEIFQIFESYPIGEKYREQRNPEKWLQPQIDKSRTKITDRAGNIPVILPESKQTGFDQRVIIDAAYSGQKGCADLFTKLFKGQFCYDHSDDTWYRFCGHFWQLEDIGKHIREATDRVQDLFQQTIRQLDGDHARLCQELKGAKDLNETERIKEKISTIEQQIKVIRKTKKALNSLYFRRQVVEFAAQGGDSLGITGNEWDCLPWGLPCLNGVVDLKTGHIRNGNPNDYLKAVCPAVYDPSARAPRFEKALLEIFGNDIDLVLFFQRVIGMAIVGATIEHKLIVLWGAGRNGKDTLLETFAHVFGNDVAGAIQAETLLDSSRNRGSGGPSADIIRLRGLRITWASETNDGRRLDSGKIKLLTGGGELTGRAPHAKRYTTFKPSHTLFLLTNSKPHASADDFALWKRILLVPFEKAFVDDPEKPNERKADKMLLDKLKAEASGILNWAIEGCLEWQKYGLKPPKKVKAATAKYRDEEDLLQQFINDTCIVGEQFTVKASLFYQHYKSWMEENNLKPLSGTMFGKKMSERFEKVSAAQSNLYQGIGIIENG